MSFMQKQITNKQNWLRVETSQGTEFVNTSDLSLFVRDSSTVTHQMSETELDETRAKIQPYTEGTPESWENIKGYGVRLSAPGYMDCTPWDVFDSVEEAQQYLDETYSDEDEEDEQ
jgi:hypothetical protein